jgi:hypothetical protein
LACDGDNIYFTWSWFVTETTSNNDRRIRSEESGVYFCSKTGNQWNKAERLNNLGEQPQVVVGKDGKIHVFWIEEGKGLFCRIKTGTEWNDAHLLVKDKTIRVREIGLPFLPSCPFSITVDKNNNFHIVYIHESPGQEKPLGYRYPSEELMYLKLSCVQE